MEKKWIRKRGKGRRKRGYWGNYEKIKWGFRRLRIRWIKFKKIKTKFLINEKKYIKCKYFEQYFNYSFYNLLLMIIFYII